MDYLSAGAGIVVHDKLGFFDTGREVPLFLGNDIVVITSAVCIVISAKRGCRKHAHRERTCEHTYSEQRNQNFRNWFFHVFSPFFNFIFRNATKCD